QIYLQKWIALFKQCEEAWAECRRTDIPLMHEAPGSSYQTHNRPPFRWRYPDDEYNLNSANIAPAAIGIKDYFWGTDNGKMWWDTRTGVH
ncbi:MAG: SusD/RagB family nutrient-binding outer membrane lipoprotein, partial [Bacteroidales bacterium]|nr:SusD/RagB family nutrient-binding outer membrane lipoprotein [Bacteroidales bacterium]